MLPTESRIIPCHSNVELHFGMDATHADRGMEIWNRTIRLECVGDRCSQYDATIHIPDTT